MASLITPLPSSLRSLPLVSSFLSISFLLLLLLSTSPLTATAQTCNRNSCSPNQGSLPHYPANTCDLCATNGTCATAYYNVPGFSCGEATLTVNGAVQLRRAQCCPSSYDGENEYVCVSEQHSEEDGVVDGYSCLKVGPVVSALRVGLLVGSAVCIVAFVALSVCVWRYFIKVPERQLAIPQYQQSLVAAEPSSLQPSSSSSQPSQSAAPYQPPSPHTPPVSEHRPQYDQPSEVDTVQHS